MESEHIKTVTRTKNHHHTLTFLCFHQYLDKKVEISFPELSIEAYSNVVKLHC